MQVSVEELRELTRLAAPSSRFHRERSGSVFLGHVVKPLGLTRLRYGGDSSLILKLFQAWDCRAGNVLSLIRPRPTQGSALANLSPPVCV